MALGIFAKRAGEMGDSNLQSDNLPPNQVCMDRDKPLPEDKPGEEEEDSDEEAYAIANFNQILEHNCALRNNFEELKQLHLQLTDSNLKLHQACIRINQEKEALEKSLSESKVQKELLQTSLADLVYLVNYRLSASLQEELEHAHLTTLRWKILATAETESGEGNESLEDQT